VVFGLNARARNDWLPLLGPRDKVITEEQNVTRVGLARVRKVDPVGVGVNNKVDGRRSSKEAEIDHRGANVKGCLALSIHRSRTWLRVDHASVLEDVDDVLVEREMCPWAISSCFYD
jgi:hypothetical protein